MLTNLIQLCLSLPQPLSASLVTSLTTSCAWGSRVKNNNNKNLRELSFL